MDDDDDVGDCFGNGMETKDLCEELCASDDHDRTKIIAKLWIIHIFGIQTQLFLISNDSNSIFNLICCQLKSYMKFHLIHSRSGSNPTTPYVISKFHPTSVPRL